MVGMKAASLFTSSLRSQRHRLHRLNRLNYQPLLFTLALLAIFTCLSLSRTLWNHKNKNETMQQQQQQQQPQQPPTPSNDTPTKMQVNYIEVPSGRSDVKRYHATLNSTTTSSTSDQPISIRKWMSLVSSNSTEGIRAASDLSKIIASSSYNSLLFEIPGTSWESSDRDQFEFAIVDKPALAERAEKYPDRDAFAEHFEKCHDDSNDSTEDSSMVCSFANLGGDAQLVAPLPQQPSRNCCAPVLGCSVVNDRTYSHLAAFERNAPKCQVSEFWRVGANRMLETLERKHNINTQQGRNVEDNDKTWFSTNGMGVSWLHLRLDGRPKYYDYEPFAYLNANRR